MFRINAVIVLAILSAAPIAQAKDVTAQQAGVEYARGLVEKSQLAHKEDLLNVTDSEKHVDESKKKLEEAKKKLEADKKKAELSQQQLDEANAKLTRAQNLLDEAWKK